MPAEALPQPRHQHASQLGRRSEDDFGNTAASASRSLPGGASTGAAVGLYATPSYASLYVEPEDLEPGPGSYDTAGNFGHQTLSTIRSQPSLSMTARHDKSWQKVMITKDHLSALMARDTPGPGTYAPLQALSQSRVRFGTSKRGGIADGSFRAPGPVYDTEVPTGDHQKVKVKFGRALRFTDADPSKGVPAPGDYPKRTSFNGTRFSKSFGVSRRAYDRVWFPGCERVEVGRMSPGPGEATPFHNSGKSHMFGNAARMPPNLAANRAPGPGAYDNHERETAVAESSPKFGMGRPHARDRLNLKQMKTLTHASSWGLMT